MIFMKFHVFHGSVFFSHKHKGHKGFWNRQDAKVAMIFMKFHVFHGST